MVSAIGDTTDRLIEALEAAAAGEEARALSGLSRLQRDTERVLREFFAGGSAAVEAELVPFFDELARMARAVAVLHSVPAAGRDHFLAHGEMAASRVYGRTPRGRAVRATADAVNEALRALQGQTLDEVTVSPQGHIRWDHLTCL